MYVCNVMFLTSSVVLRTEWNLRGSYDDLDVSSRTPINRWLLVFDMNRLDAYYFLLSTLRLILVFSS
jgi:hypothetical protein